MPIQLKINFRISLIVDLNRPSSTSHLWTLVARSLPKRASSHYSRVLGLTSSVVLLVLVCCPSTTRPSSSYSENSSRVDPDKCTTALRIGALQNENAVVPRIVVLVGCGKDVVLWYGDGWMHMAVQQVV